MGCCGQRYNLGILRHTSCMTVARLDVKKIDGASFGQMEDDGAKTCEQDRLARNHLCLVCLNSTDGIYFCSLEHLCKRT